MDALILAGGENRRMPVIKGFLEITGSRIIDANVRLFKKLFDRIFISTNNPELYFYLDVRMVGDVIKYRGPMTGIFSALSLPGVSEFFVTACDMPFLNDILVRYMLDKWESAHDALIPVFNKEQQPFPGIYSKKIAHSMEESIKSGKRSLKDFLKKRNVFYISESKVRSMDEKGKSFVNINTAEDFRREGGRIC
jgi:molybdenum cofactor guanylyltransferase